MSKKYYLYSSAFILLILLNGCATTSRLHDADVPDGSLRVGQVMGLSPHSGIIQASWYPDVLAAGIKDSDLEDNTIAAARIFCCGGPEVDMAKILYIPKEIKAEIGDFVEFRVGHQPQNGDGGRLNTVTRVVAKHNEPQQSCSWIPKNDKLWMRTPYCGWMQQEGWIKQDDRPWAWYKPAPTDTHQSQ